MVDPGSSGADSHFESRKSRVSDRAVQIRAAFGFGEASTVNRRPAVLANFQESPGIGRPAATWRKKAPMPLSA